MAFVPNTAAPAPIILHHTPSDTATPALLYPGEAAVCHGPTHTKMWIGDGVTNRLFLSTNPADSPLLNQSVLGGPFLPLTGGTLAGPGNLTLDGGALRLSGAIPTVIFDVASGSQGPMQWSLEAEDYWFGFEQDGYYPVYLVRDSVGEYRVALDDNTSLHVTGGTRSNGTIFAEGGLNADGGVYFAGPGMFRIRNDIIDIIPATSGMGHFVDMRFTKPDPVTSSAILADIWVNGIAGIDNTPNVASIGPGQSIAAAGIRFLSTQGWQRDTTVDPGDPGPPIIPPSIISRTDYLGSEIAFFVSENGGPEAYRAMTLEQNANLTVVGTVTASGSLLTSDPDLKDDIARAPSGALAKVCELPVIDFNWKRGSDAKRHRGFSADDVKRVMGEDSGCSAKGAYSLADMNAMLWRAVQELSEEVQELKQRVIH